MHKHWKRDFRSSGFGRNGPVYLEQKPEIPVVFHNRSKKINIQVTISAIIATSLMILSAFTAGDCICLPDGINQ